MGFLPSSPLSLFGAPLLFVASLPLAILAAFTTSVAVSLLAIRVSVVYLELGVALVHASLFPEPAKPVPRRVVPPPSPPRVRRIGASPQDVAPAARLGKSRRSGSSTSLVGVGIDQRAAARDFEGVGGWRYYEGDKDEDEAIWMGMNRRLQLPLALPPGRRHQRRHTGEDPRWSGSPETLRMSPLQSRMRTPQRTPKATATPNDDEDYFPALRPLSTAVEPLGVGVHSMSAGGSSSSSSQAGLV